MLPWQGSLPGKVRIPWYQHHTVQSRCINTTQAVHLSDSEGGVSDNMQLSVGMRENAPKIKIGSSRLFLATV